MRRLQQEVEEERKLRELPTFGIDRGMLVYGLEDGQGVLFLGGNMMGDPLNRLSRPELDRLNATFKYLADKTTRLIAESNRRADAAQSGQ